MSFKSLPKTETLEKDSYSQHLIPERQMPRQKSINELKLVLKS